MKIEKKLIQNVLNQKPKALLTFSRQVNPYLKSILVKKISNPHDLDEVIQDTFYSILDSLPQFKFQSSFKTWCFAIARHELVDYYRRKKIKHLIFSHFPFLKTLADKALGPQLALEEKQKKQKIYQTLKNLSEGYSLVLRLRYIEGLSVKKISQKLNITYKAAESRLSRARLAFQKEFV